MRWFERGAEATGSVSGGSAGFRACRSSASRGASTASREPRRGRPRFARLLSLGRSLKALEVRKREKAGVCRDRGAAGRESGGWRRTRGRGSSLERPDDPGEISARNETPRRTFRGQGAAERGGAGALREGGRHGDARRWMCSDVSQKARRPPTEFRGSVLGEEGDVSVRNERGSSDRTDAGTAPGVVARGRAADVAETPDEPGRAKRGGPFEV